MHASALARGGPIVPVTEMFEYAATIAAASESLSTMVSNILRLNKRKPGNHVTLRHADLIAAQKRDCALDTKKPAGRRRLF